MPAINGDAAARPLLLLHHRHRAHHTQPRRGGESWMPVVFGVCVMLFVVTTWVGTHRTISSLEAGQLSHAQVYLGAGWASRGDRSAPGDAGAYDDGGGGGGGEPAHGPGPGDTTAVVTSGPALARMFGALSSSWGAAGAHAAAAAAGAPAHDAAHDAAGAREAAGAALPEGERDIELHPDRVAAVVGRAKAAAIEQMLQQGDAGPGGEMAATMDSAERYQSLYGANAGSIFFGPISGAESAACPAGGPSLRGTQAAVAVLAGPGSAARLERTMQALLRRWGHVPEDVRGLFHVYIAVDGSDPDVKKVAMHYAVETMGIVRLVHHNATTSPPPPPGPCGAPDPARPSHVLFLLRLFLECFGYPSLLVLPEGARLAADALPLFAGAQWLLTSDPTLWCVSGGSGLFSGAAAARRRGADPGLLLRTDEVGGPARSWMVSRDVGAELLAAWRAGGAPRAAAAAAGDTAGGWLAFLRSGGARRGRQCVVPDVPRVAAAGCGGAAGEADADADGDDGDDGGGRSGGGVASGGGGSGSGGAEGGAAGAAAAAGARRRRSGRVAWMEADLAWLMEPGYSRVVLERLRHAAPAKLSALSDLQAGGRARRLRYGAPPEYRAQMDVLGLTQDAAPMAAGERYCYPVPVGPPPPAAAAGRGGAAAAVGVTKEHCQDFVPPLAYRGVVPTYTAAGARVFVVPAAYDAALPVANPGGTSSSSGSGESSGGGGGKAGAAAPFEAEPEVSASALDDYLGDVYGDQDGASDVTDELIYDDGGGGDDDEAAAAAEEAYADAAPAQGGGSEGGGGSSGGAPRPAAAAAAAAAAAG